MLLDKHDEAFALMREARATRNRVGRSVERVDTSVGTSFEGLRTVLEANRMAAALLNEP